MPSFLSTLFRRCFGLPVTYDINGPEFDILKEGEEQYGLTGAEGDTLDLSITSYCWALSQRFSARVELQNAAKVKEVHLMREPHRRKYVDPGVPYDGAGGYRQVQDFDRDGVELDWWQKVPEREAEYLVVSGMDFQGAMGYIRLEREWTWERASPQQGLEAYDYNGDGEVGDDMSTWRPRRSVAVPHVIINRQSKLQRHGYGRRDLELGAITFGAQGKDWARERGKQEETAMFLHELALLALAVHRIQRKKTPWKAESRRRLREGNYAKLLFDLVEQRKISRFQPMGEVWYEGTERQEDIDRLHTIHEFCGGLDKFEQKIVEKEQRKRRKAK
ncbi:hypothetical protein CPB84DRAFT_1772867, partial [Gymnopilus junonius]